MNGKSEGDGGREGGEERSGGEGATSLSLDETFLSILVVWIFFF